MEFQIDIEKLKSKKLFLGIPMYGANCSGPTVSSLMELAGTMAAYGIKMQTYFMFNESLITRARSFICDEFLRSESDTLLFIDSDISFKAIDILAMMYLQNEDREKYNVVAGPYPKKTISFEKIVEAVNQGKADDNPNNLENYVGDYVFNMENGSSFRLDEPVKVKETGTGFMMITRECLETIKEKFPDFYFKPDHVRSKNFDGSRDVYCFFDTEIDKETRRYLSEDYFFCKYVRKSGMNVWLFPWIELSHQGSYNYGGSLSAMAEIGLAHSYRKSKNDKK